MSFQAFGLMNPAKRWIAANRAEGLRRDETG